MQFTSHSAEQTQQLGFKLGQRLAANSVVCLFGDLGAGKTTFIKGIAAGAAGVAPEQVNSPTFVYLNIYEGTQTIFHFDLYRLKDADEFLSMGFDEYFYCQGICCVEWSERISALLPADCVSVRLASLDPLVRQITIGALENP